MQRDPNMPPLDDFLLGLEHEIEAKKREIDYLQHELGVLNSMWTMYVEFRRDQIAKNKTS